MFLAAMAGIVGLGYLGFTTMQMTAPTAGNAIQTCLTDEITATTQRVYANNPSLELSQSVLTGARARGFINHDQFLAAMARNGINNNRANLELQISRNYATLDTLAEAFFRKDITLDTYLHRAKILAIPTEDATIYLHARRQMPSAIANVENLWRGNITKERYYDLMQGLGFVKDDADLILQAQYFLPPVQDLIRFQVRDIFRPDVVEKYGYAEEFPEAIMPHAKRIGLSREVMEQYWRAHWILPSPTQAYEFLHRLHPEVLEHTAHTYDFPPEFMRACETTPETIEDFLRISDYPTFWRRRLLAISYKSLTRVDLRRLYVLGMVTDDYVIATLREGGYSRFDATKLLAWFKRERTIGQRDMTIAQSLSAFNRGIITREQFEIRYKEMGFDSEDLRVILAVNKENLREKDFNDKIKVVREEYIHGLLTDLEVEGILANMGLNAQKVRLYRTKFRQAKRRNIRLPSLRDLHNFFRNNIINETEYREELKTQGFTEKHIEWYVRSITTPT